MSDTDEIRQLRAEKDRIAARVAVIERRIGKLPLRIAGTSGGGTTSSDIEIIHAAYWLNAGLPSEMSVVNHTPTGTFAFGVGDTDKHFGVYIFGDWILLSHWEADV